MLVNNRWLKRLGMISGFMVLSGCVSGEARNAAKQLSGLTLSIQKNSEEFARSRETLAKARMKNMNWLEMKTLGTEQKVLNKKFALKASEDKQRWTLYQVLIEGTKAAGSKQSEMENAINKHDQALAQSMRYIKAPSKQLGESTKVLIQLSKEPKLLDELGFFKDFIGEVAKSQEAAKKDAVKQSQEGLKSLSK